MLEVGWQISSCPLLLDLWIFFGKLCLQLSSHASVCTVTSGFARVCGQVFSGLWYVCISHFGGILRFGRAFGATELSRTRNSVFGGSHLSIRLAKNSALNLALVPLAYVFPVKGVYRRVFGMIKSTNACPMSAQGVLHFPDGNAFSR